MKVVATLAEAGEVLAGRACVLSIGNFDGLHLGHQKILQCVVRRARELDLPAVAMTFEPHPIQVLAPDKAPKRISSAAQKIRLMEESGIDLLVSRRFDLEFASLSAEDFINQYLIAGLRIHSICVGANFNFGCRQTGTTDTLRQWTHLFELVEVPPVLVRGVPASSTRVRDAVLSGAVSEAARFLGRWFEIEGRIVSGAGRGRNVTVPTLNLAPSNELLPKHGVYASRIALDRSSYLESITNVGVRPTFDDAHLTIETFVLGKSAPPAAAQNARLQFLHRIRDEQRFDSAALLAAQIQRDVRKATRFFQLLGNIGHATTHTR